MEIKIQAIHFDAAETLINFANKKIEKLARKAPYITYTRCDLRLVKPEAAHNKEAVLTLQYPGHADIVASKQADTFEEAIDLAIAALEPQLQRLKER